MFGSDDFPLGPNGEFPRQRIKTYGNEIFPPEDAEGVYLESGLAKLPVVERDFHSSLNKVNWRMKEGRPMREGQREMRFRPVRMPKRGKRLMFGNGESKF
jgi:hypothetical protein